MSNHGNRTLASKRGSCNPDPCNLIRQWLIFLEHNHRIRPKIGEVWAKIATAMMARSPAIRWRYVRGQLSAVIVTLLQHNWIPIRHTSWKDPKATDGVSRVEVWELMIGDSGKPSELRLRSNRGRRLQGRSWEQVWMAGQTSPRCSNMTNSWRKEGLHAARGMLLAAATVSCWTQERRYRARLGGRGRGYAP